jgi:glutathione S-transferase
MRLYDDPCSGNGYKVRLILALLGQSYDYVPLDIDKAETRTPEFLAKNPNGRIPLLELDDGRLLPESNAILHYLADSTPFLPADPFAHAQVLQWMFFEQYSHEPNIATVRFWLTHRIEMTPWLLEAAERKRAGGYAALGVMDTHLRQTQFFAADAFTIADIALYAYTHVAHEGGFDLSGYPAVTAWLDRVAAQPGHVPITAVQR